MSPNDQKITGERAVDRAAPLLFDLLLRELVVLRSQRLRILGFLSV